ncbi:MAG: response regulator [Elainella sp.]
MSSAYRSHLKESILIVDGAPDSLRQLTGQLAEQGYRVQVASSGGFALKLAQAQLPALIVLEVDLPDGNGYQLCQALKADRRTRNVPVVFLSALTTTSAKIEAFRAGGVDYIAKPFELEEVLIRLETHLSTQRLQQHLIEQNLQLQRESTQREQAECLLEQQLQRTVLLQQVTAALQSEADSQVAFEAAVAQIGRVLQVNRAAIHIYVPPPMPEIPLIAEYVESGYGSLGQIDFTLADGWFIRELLTADRAIAVADVYRDPRLQSIRELCRAAGMQSLLAVRTSYRNQPNGVLILQHCEARVWAEAEIALVEAMAIQVGIALAQVKSLEQEQKQLEALGYQNLILRQEICERRQVELALQESEAEIRGLFAAMVDVVLVLDRQGRYLRIAPTSPKNLYKPATELLGKTLHQVFSPAQAELFLSQIQTSLKLRQTIDFEYSLVIQGQTVWFNTKISPVSEDTVISVAHDITARKQTEAELLQKTVALSNFSTNLQHLHRLSLTDFETVGELCADYLKTGCEILRFSSGLVGQKLASGVANSLPSKFCLVFLF